MRLCLSAVDADYLYSSAYHAKRFTWCKLQTNTEAENSTVRGQFVWRVVFIDVYSVRMPVATMSAGICFVTQRMIPISER